MLIPPNVNWILQPIFKNRILQQITEEETAIFSVTTGNSKQQTRVAEKVQNNVILQYNLVWLVSPTGNEDGRIKYMNEEDEMYKNGKCRKPSID